MPNCGCNDYTRTQLLRRAAAEAGRGLPAIEPGMPDPAGTGLTRRKFVSASAGLAMAVYGASTLAPQAFEEGIADAAAQSADDRVLVSIFLSGGADSLSMLAPKRGTHNIDTLRPELRLDDGEGVDFSEDSTLRWHPALSGLADLHAQNKLTAMPTIGYASPNQSHFTSRHYWEVGEVNPFGRWGWLGRYLDLYGRPDNPLQGLTLGWDLQPSLAARNVPVATVGRPDQYGFSAPYVYNPVSGPMLDAFGDLGDLPTGDAGLGQARAAVASTGRLRDQLLAYGSPPSHTVKPAYPANSEFARRLSWIARMLADGKPLKVVAIESGGYDTHSNQEGTLPGDLLEIGNSLKAFQADLQERGLEDRVLTFVWSEFGRRPRENAGGTDHGAAGSSFLIGSQVKRKMQGSFQRLDVTGAAGGLDSQGNLKSTVDFRAVYCALLREWMGADPARIIPNAGSFEVLDLVQ